MSNSNLLPIVELPAQQARRGVVAGRGKAWLLHLYRVGILVLILWVIREHHLWVQAQEAHLGAQAIKVEQVRQFFPTAAKLTAYNPTHGGRYVADATGKLLGYVMQTAPDADFIIGYVGPTNVLIALDKNSTILGFTILKSGDTFEHVEKVKHHVEFMTALNGRSTESATTQPFEAVSGATLTSIAVVESITFRLAGKRLSYKFPDVLTLADVAPFFPEADQLVPLPERDGLTAVLNAEKKKLGTVLRTSPSADDLNGYQGPIETLVAFDVEGKVLGIGILKHYETPKYVNRIAADTRFMQLFNGMTLKKLANIDVFDDEIEGTSGATMTSITMVDGMRDAAKKSLIVKQPKRRGLQIQSRDIGTVSIVLLALVISFTRLRGIRTVRIVFQLSLVVYLGFMNADFFSQAILIGWVKSSAPWKVAPGLVLLVAAAIALPLVSRNQLYCHHICPHGALQQLLRYSPTCRFLFPKRLASCLKWLPAVLLLGVLLTAMLWPAFNLAAVEPFDAYLFRTAGWATLAIAIVGLGVSLCVPMAFCRFGCPTGAFLDYLRLSGRNDKFAARDLFALLLLGIAVSIWYFHTV